MLNRRHFLTTSAAALVAGPLAAQTAAVQEASVQPQMEGSFVIPPEYWAQIVTVKPEFPAGEIHIVPQTHFLYYTIGNSRAIRYGVAVGKEGLQFHGDATIQRKVEWPSWTPTPEMIQRSPSHYAKYADGMPGGPNNPLGARALYLFQNGNDTAIRIHGTTEPASIGSSASNGCFRMYNSHVMDLYNRVPLGTVVHAY